MAVSSLSKVSPFFKPFDSPSADTTLPPTGVAYQLVSNDPLIDTKQCQLDAALMKELGANTIRVYHVDALADHTGCMQAFADAGVYLFVDLDTFPTYIKLVGLQLLIG
jgi:Glucanosyltransferase